MFVVPGSAYLMRGGDVFSSYIVILHRLNDLYDFDSREWDTTYAGIISGNRLVTRDYPTGLTDKIYLTDSDFICPGDYTLECFVEFGEQPTAGAQVGQGILASSAAQGPYVYLNCESGSNTMRWFVNGGTRTTTKTLNQDTEYHIAICRSGTTTYLWVDGELIDSTTAVVGNAISNGELLFGGTQYGGNNLFKVMIEEIRLTKAARYTSPFTPPTHPFPDPT